MKINFKIVLLLLILSSVLGLVVNHFSTKGIPLIAEKKELQWADDSLFDIPDNEPENLTQPPADHPDENIQLNEEKKDVQQNVTDKPDEEKPKEEKTSAPETDPTTKTEEKKDEPPLPTAPVAINIQQAYRLFQQNVLFIDAREPAEYNYAHIEGAINIPFDHFNDYKHLLDNIEEDKMIITYCGGTDCDLSILLGNVLFDLGYKKTFVFFGGWNDWLEAGYPTVSSEQ